MHRKAYGFILLLALTVFNQTCAGGGSSPGGIISDPPSPPPIDVFALALDNSSLSFRHSAGNSENWFYQSAETKDGLDALQSGLLGDGQKSCFETILKAPGTVSFQWKVSSEDSRDHARFYVNGTVKEESSGDLDWAPFTHILTNNGDTDLRWCYEKDSANSDYMDTVWIDQLVLISFDNDYSENLQDALDEDSASLNFAPSLDNNADWFSQDIESHEGPSALQSGDIADEQRSCFETSLQGPQVLRFFWKVSSQDGGDFLKFYIDGLEEESITGDVDWVPIEEALFNNTSYDLKWCYEKDASAASGEDHGWVDILNVSDLVENANALDTTQSITNSAGNDADWFGQKRTRYDDGDGNDDALESGAIEDSQTSCFETQVMAPQRVNFYWKVDSEASADHLKFYVGSTEIDALSGNVDWTQLEHLLTGSLLQTLKWCYEKNASGASGEDRGWVDKLELSNTVEIAIALDTTESITNSAGDDADWSGQTTTYYNDGSTNNDALQSGAIGNSQTSCFETDVTAPQRVNFYWKVDSEASADHLKFYVGSTEIDALSGNVDWTQLEHLLTGSGSHTLKWCYEKNASAASGEDRGWVDKLRLSELVDSATALDTAETITNSGGNDADWSGQTTTFYNDGGGNTNALQSGLLEDNQTSCFETTVTAPRRVSFYWKVNSEASKDHLEFYVDSTREKRISGDTSWTPAQHLLTGSSTHTLKWCYTKDASGASGEDRGWVDKLSLSDTVDSATALDTAETITNSGGNDADWFGQSVSFYNDSLGNNDALQSGLVGDGESSCFETTVTAPQRVTFYWKVSSQANGDYLEFYAGGIRQKRISGDTSWAQAEHLLIGSGDRILQWCYKKNASAASGQDQGWVDKLRLSNTIQRINALDTTRPISDSSGDDADWFGQTMTFYSDGDGNDDALQSGLVGDSESSCFEVATTAPRRISFYWKVDSEAGSDHLKFYVNNAELDSISGTVDWTETEYLLNGSGDRVFEMVL